MEGISYKMGTDEVSVAPNQDVKVSSDNNSLQKVSVMFIGGPYRPVHNGVIFIEALMILL